ncbi:hypothetical protein QYE76_035437 [Lolium multiflorum]|uniref:Retrotransposon gag domain-containing protein n=1 Tax=Lolium multiflorum TaxID=4521 RepID=A0AAD8VM66_LOLMU|nr:hypothetical protein QYE76_035437 [Lolium multiflorum]
MPSCCRIQGGATTSAARWNGEKDVVFINTERVTEYEEGASIARGGEEQLDKKADVKLDMELDKKTSHGSAREEREACARGGRSPGRRQPGRPAATPAHPIPGPDKELKETIDGVSKKLDTTNKTVNAMQDQMTDIQRNIQALTLAVENLTQKQQHREDEDAELQDEAPGVGRGAGRGNRGRGFVELGRHGRGFEEEDGLSKPKFLIPKFEGGADVEEYLTWELKIEKLWRLHNYTEDRKIKLASSEFDGYALRWWDGLVRSREEDGELPIITWRAMKAAMQARFVPTNYLRSIYDKLTLLRQGVKTVDTYFMEMEMLMQRGRVRESLEMTMQRFLHGLKYDIKGIVRHHSYTTMNELLHHAREAESQLAEEAQVLGRATGAGIARGGEEQLDKKLDVKLDMELAMKLDMKTSHGSAREEREACARGEEEVQAGAMPG